MATLLKSDLKRDKGKKKYALQDQPVQLNAPQFLLQEEQLKGIKKLGQKIRILKRISPFFIVAACLPVLFMYAVIENIHHILFQFFLFVFIEVNILTIDFALWNYHEGNKIWRIWMIEMSVILSALYFIV